MTIEADGRISVDFRDRGLNVPGFKGPPRGVQIPCPITLAALAVDGPAVYQPLILNDRWGGDPSTLRDVHVKSVQFSRTPEARESVKQE